MKKCPDCAKTFDDAMRFCQTCGTALVDDAPPLDPYKTIVASPSEIAAAIPSAPAEPAVPDLIKEDDVLQLPQEADPKKTMFASEEEIRREMEAHAPVLEPADPVIDIPPVAPDPPSFGGMSSGASSDAPIANPSDDMPFSKTTPPIPSPFGGEKTPSDEPAFAPEPVLEPLAAQTPPSPFSNSPVVSEPEALFPVSNFEESSDMQNAPVNAAGQNKTLAIISLVVGCLSILCCGWFIPGIAAIIMGFMARSKAANDPMNYGGAGLALGGILTGVFSLVLGVIVLVLYLFTGVFAGLMRGL